MSDRKRLTAREMLDEKYRGTNTYDLPHLYAPDNYRQGEFTLPWGVAGGYDTSDHSIKFQSGKANADTVAHEATHYDVGQKKRDQGTPKSMYMPDMNVNDIKKYRERAKMLNSLRKIVDDHYMGEYGLVKDPNGSYMHTRTSKSIDGDIPANFTINDEEVVAALRGLHGGQKTGSTFWDTPDGGKIKGKLDEQYPDTLKTRKILDSLMFPQTRFMDEWKEESMLDKVKRIFNL